MKKFGLGAAVELGGLLDRPAWSSSASSGETSSETRPSTPSARSLTGLKFRGAAQIGERELEEEVVALESAVGEFGHLVVVGVTAVHRLVEDRRVRRQSGDRELVDVGGERALIEHRPG